LKGQALPPLASRIPRDLYIDNSNGRRYCRMAVGLACKKILQVSEFPDSKYYWVSKEKCHWTKYIRKNFIDQIREGKPVP